MNRTLSLEDQHFLDTFKLGLPLNVYVNLAHIDHMAVTLNMVKGPIVISTLASPGVSAMSHFPFMAASSHDRMASGMYHKPDIPKQVTFQDSALLSVLQKSTKC